MSHPASIGRPAVAPPRPARPRRLAGAALIAPLTTDPLRLTLFAMMLVTISRIHQLVPPLKVLRPGITLTAAALALAAMMPKAIAAREFMKAWPARRVLIILSLAIVGIPFGLGAAASVKFLTEVYLPNLVFFGLLVIAVRNVADLRMLILSYVASVSVLLYLSLFVWGAQSFNGFSRMASTVMYDANDLGVVFCAGIPLALLIGQTSKGPVKWFAYLIAAGSPASVALGGSRGGFLSLGMTAVWLLIMAPKITWARRISIVLTAVVVVAIFAPDGYMKQMSTIWNPGEDYNVTSATGRVEIWKRGLRNLAPRPIFGVGLNNFARAQWVNQEYAPNGAPIRAMSSHNTFLQMAVDLGVPAFLVFLSILLGGTVGMLKLRSRLPRSWLTQSADKRFLYTAASYLPVSYFGWATGAFFVSHAYLMPFYTLTAYQCGVLLLLRREMRDLPGARDRVRPAPPAPVPVPTAVAPLTPAHPR